MSVVLIIIPSVGLGSQDVLMGPVCWLGQIAMPVAPVLQTRLAPDASTVAAAIGACGRARQWTSACAGSQFEFPFFVLRSMRAPARRESEIILPLVVEEEGCSYPGIPAKAVPAPYRAVLSAQQPTHLHGLVAEAHSLPRRIIYVCVCLFADSCGGDVDADPSGAVFMQHLCSAISGSRWKLANTVSFHR